MRSRRNFLYFLVMGAGVGVLVAGPVGAQSVGFGNGLIDVLDAEGDTIFNVGSGNDVNVGGSGADVDFIARTSTGAQSLFFNTSNSDLTLGGTSGDGNIFLLNTGATAYTFYAYGSSGDLILGGGTSDGDLTLRAGTTTTITADGGTGDLTLGGGSYDGDIILKDHTSGLTNFNADGATGYLTLGSYGSAGDAGRLHVRDSNGITNNINIYGSNGDITAGSSSSGDDGDLSLHDGVSLWGIQLSGASGSITNKPVGNGIVKAWARVNSNGTISSSYRTNLSTAETRQLGIGVYEVDFSSSYFDTSTRPVLCTPGHSGTATFAGYQVSCSQRSGDSSSIYVITRNFAGTLTNSAFTIVVF